MGAVSPHYLQSSEGVAPVPSQVNQENNPAAALSLVGLVLVLVVAVWGRQRLQRFVKRKYQVHRTIVLLQRIVALERLLSPRPLSRK